MDACITEGDLDLCHAGELSEEDRDRISSHVVVCAACRRLEAELISRREALADRARAAHQGGRFWVRTTGGRVAAVTETPVPHLLDPPQSPLVKGGGNSGVTPDPEAAGFYGLSIRARRGGNSGATPDPEVGETSALHLPEVPGYEIRDEIHRGGQGVVYRALQQSTGRQVAVKLLRHGPFSGRGDKARFEREIRALAQLDHPNVVTIHDSGTCAAGHYLVMNYVAGPTLDEYVQSRKSKVESPNGSTLGVSLGDSLALFVKICHAVHAAHLRGVIHRDLKPSNIRIGPGGEPKILDFGLAKVSETEGAARGLTLTETGQFMGSLPWASPEQAQGLAERADLRTDVYSLGVMLYQILTHRFPYPIGGAVREVLSHIVDTEPTHPGSVRTGLDEDLDTIVLKCLQKDRERRYQTAGELAHDLERYLSGEPIEARRDSMLYVLRKRLLRHRVVATLSLALAAMMLALATVTTLQTRGVARQRDRAVMAEKLAERERDRADAQRRRADGEARSLRESLYRHSVALALGAYQESRIDRMVELLDSCPPELRNWEWSRLAWLSDGSLRVVPYVRPDACFSADGRTVLAHHGSAVAVWDTTTWQKLREIKIDAPAENWSVRDLSADGTRFVMSTVVGDILVGLTETGQILKRWPPTLQGPLVALSPSGHLLCHSAGTILSPILVVEEIDTGHVLLNTPIDRFGQTGPVFSADDKEVWLGHGNRLTVWELASGRLRLDVKLDFQQSRPGSGLPLALSADGRQVLVPTTPGRLGLLDAVTGTLQFQLGSEALTAHTAAFSLDGRWIALGGGSLVSLCDAATGRLVRTFHGHRGNIARVAFVGNTLVSSSFDSTIRLWNLDHHPDQLAPIEAHANYAAFSPDNRWIATANEDGHVSLWDRRNLSAPLWVSAVKHDRPNCVSFSPDGLRLVSSSHEGQADVWDARTGGDLATLSGHATGIPAVAWSPDGRWIASASWDRTCWIWDADSYRFSKKLAHKDEVWDLAFSRDGKWLATGTKAGEVKVWDPATGRLILDRHTDGAVDALAFSPDGRELVSGGSDGWIQIWDISSGRLRVKTRTYGEQAYCATYTPDGRRILVGTIGKVEVFDGRSGAAIVALPAPPGLTGSIFSLEFAHHSRDLVVASINNVFAIWPAASNGRQNTTAHGSEALAAR